jgi:hypothetical protein
MLTCEVGSPALGSHLGAERAAVPGPINWGEVFTPKGTPLFLGLRSFNLTCVPEPSSLGIGALRAVSLWFAVTGMVLIKGATHNFSLPSRFPCRTGFGRQVELVV